MTENILLTEPAIKRLKPNHQLRWIKDSGSTALYLVIQPRQPGDKSNPKSWMLRFRRDDGRIAKIKLGPYDLSNHELKGDPEVGQPLGLAGARALAADLLRQRARGDDIAAEHKARRVRVRTEIADKAALAFGSCVREFFVDYRTRKHGSRPRRWTEDARTLGLSWPRDCDDPASTGPGVIRGGLADKWADKSVAEIDEAMIIAVVDDARKFGIGGLDSRNGGVSEARGRRMHAALSVFFRWLRRKRRVLHNPCRDVDHPGPPAAREHFLNENELRWLWRACDDEPIFGPPVRLLILCGQRLNECAGLKKSELSDDGVTWTIPSTRTKNHFPHIVHLAGLAREQIASSEGAGDFVFSTTAKSSLSGWSRCKARLHRKMQELARKELGAKAKIRPWRLHDLRRGFVTGCGELGVSGEIVELCVNHVSGTRKGVAGTYNLSERLPERKACFERWARHVEGLVARRPANITDIASKKVRRAEA
jgi:integrase